MHVSCSEENILSTRKLLGCKITQQGRTGIRAAMHVMAGAFLGMASFDTQKNIFIGYCTDDDKNCLGGVMTNRYWP